VHSTEYSRLNKAEIEVTLSQSLQFCRTVKCTQVLDMNQLSGNDYSKVSDQSDVTRTLLSIYYRQIRVLFKFSSTSARINGSGTSSYFSAFARPYLRNDAM